MGGSTMTLLCRKIVAMPLITFEGSEDCGKSTQMKRLAARLEKWGIRPAVLREPGGTAIGEVIRHLLQHSEDNHAIMPETELLLFEASRSQLMREKIQPALRRSEWVICDRFFDSTTVYQGAARQLHLGLVKKLNAFLVADCVPHLTFVLDIDRATAQSRLGNRKKIRDRMKEKSDEFHERMIRAYRRAGRKRTETRHPDRWANLAGYNREPNLEYICSTLFRPRKTSDSKDQTSNALNVFLR